MKKFFHHKIIIILLVLILVYLFIGNSRYSALNLFRSQSNGNNEASISNEKNGGKVLGDEANQVPSQFFTSQNYHVPEISIGGEAMTMPSGEQALAPQILDLRSELLTTKSDQAVKLAVSWKTSKPCIASVEFMRSGQQSGKIMSEGDYGYIHSAVLAPLSFTTSYAYMITAKDRWGSEIKSEKLAFYTGAPKVSIFDLLGGAFKNLFGWTGR